MIDKNDPRLTGYVLGELEPAELAEIQALLEQSEELRQAVEDIRQLSVLLEGAYESEPPLQLRENQKSELACIQVETAERVRKETTSGRPWLPIVLAAGLMGLLVGGAIFLQDSPMSPRSARLRKASENSSTADLESVSRHLDAKRMKAQAEPGVAFEGGSLAEVEEQFKLMAPLGKAVDKSDVDADALMSANEFSGELQMGERAVDAKTLESAPAEDVFDSEFDSIESSIGQLAEKEMPSASDDVGILAARSGPGASDESKMETAKAFSAPLVVAPSVPAKSPFPPSQTADANGSLNGVAGQTIKENEVARGAAMGGRFGRDSTDGSNNLNRRWAADESSTGRDPQQMMKMMQQLAGGNQNKNTPGSNAGGGFGGGGGGMGGGGMGGSFGGGAGRMGGGRQSADLGGEMVPSAGLGSGSGALEFGATEFGDSVVPQSGMGRAFRPGDDSGLAAGDPAGDGLLDDAGSRSTELMLAEAERIERLTRKGASSEYGYWSGLQSQQLANPIPGESGESSPGRAQPMDSARPVDRQAGALAEGQAAPGESSGGQPAVRQQRPETGAGGESESRGRSLQSSIAGAGENVDQLGMAQQQEELAELEQLGFRLTRRMRREQSTRSVPVQKTRPEIRSRTIDLGNGETKTENYTVDVPYVENVTEDFTVDVPQVTLDIEPAATERLVLNLVRQMDPAGTREIQIPEFFSKTRELKDSLDSVQAEPSPDVRLALKLRERLSGDDTSQLDFDATPALKKVEAALSKRNAKIRQTRTWKRVQAIPNTTRLMLGDKTELDLTGMQVNVQVDGFRARVLLDYLYYNDQDAQREGTFKLRLPDDASLYYFAFGQSAYDLSPLGDLATEEFLDPGAEFVSLRADKVRDVRQDAWQNVKESRMVPREKAAHAYGETVRQRIDPALVEWSGAGVFNARVFPLAPKKVHRIVIGYDVNLKQADGKLVYELDLPKQTGQCQVDLTVQPIDGVDYSIEPKSDPAVHVLGGKTLRHYRFNGPQQDTIRLKIGNAPVSMLQSAENYWGVQVTPDLPIEKVAGNPRAIFLLDTSLSSNPDKFNVWLKLLESTLQNNRNSLKQFNVVFFDVDARFWREQWVENTPENTQALMQSCDQLALEGATDLYGAIARIAAAPWVQGAGQDLGEPLPGPDLFLLSDGAANWGETNLRLIDRQLQDHAFGGLFAYQTGLTGTAIGGLRFLAGQSGGAVFSVATENEIKIASTAHRKRPWKLNSISATGSRDVMTAGRVQWVYPGQTITVVGRGKVLDDLKLDFEQAGQTKTVTVQPKPIQSELASRLYGSVAVDQLENLGAQVADVAAAYARHFRVTGNTCSLLMLESEADYQRFGIKPQEDLFVIESKAADELVADALQKSAAELADPKSQLLSWIQRLETMPGMSFKMPTALKLALDDIEVVAISNPLECRPEPRENLSLEYRQALQQEQLDYDLIAAEANRRARVSVDDAIKVYSSLVERNPGDLVIARDVAFTALEMGRPAQAYHLLRSVAQARPFEGHVYPALGQCLAELGQSDMAIVYYEIALEASFARMGDDFQKIVAAEYMYLLRKICDGQLESSIRPFAKARLETLKKRLHFETADLLVTMMWNTDQTDVDLHIVEPSGEECSYENKKTRSGGQITTDITTGFGPEMYSNPDAPSGKYEVKVKYFASNQNRSELKNKVHLTIYRRFGMPQERVTRKTIQLTKVGEKESIATVGVD